VNHCNYVTSLFLLQELLSGVSSETHDAHTCACARNGALRGEGHRTHEYSERAVTVP
jgi:hypothetical protein